MRRVLVWVLHPVLETACYGAPSRDLAALSCPVAASVSAAASAGAASAGAAAAASDMI